MGYKPKYAAKNRKQEPEVIRSPKPETKKQRPAKKPRSRAGNIAWMVLTAVLVPLCTFGRRENSGTDGLHSGYTQGFRHRENQGHGGGGQPGRLRPGKNGGCPVGAGRG